MSVRVIEEEFTISSRDSARVVLQADSREELVKPAVKTQAMEYARSKNFVPFAVTNFVQPYPVDQDGKSGDDLLSGKKPVKAYRVDIDLVAGMNR